MINSKVSTPVKFLDLSIRDPDEIIYMKSAISKIADHGRFINGPEVDQFNDQMKNYLGCSNALGMGSGTDALIVALLALGVGPGDEVILPCLSFVGSATAVSMVGATPIFCDVQKDLTINPELISFLITSKTKVIMPVHFAGKMAQMKYILSIAQKNNLKVIEDAAPSFGAELDGKKAGTYADIGCFSMNPMKVLGAWGEAGLVVTNTKEYEPILNQLLYHNIKDKEICMGKGINARLDGIQAASLIYRLKKINKYIQRRRKIAKYYNENLCNYVVVPDTLNVETHVYYTYSVLTLERDNLQKYLMEHDIESKIYHKHLMPRHAIYQSHHQHTQAFPMGDIIAEQILCLPIHEKMEDFQVEMVVDIVHEYFRKQNK